MPTIKLKQKRVNSKVAVALAVIVVVVVAAAAVVAVRITQGVYSPAESYDWYSELSTLLFLKNLSFLVFATWNFELKTQCHLTVVL